MYIVGDFNSHFYFITGQIENEEGQIYFFFKKNYFQRGGREGEKEGEKHQCVAASRMPLTGDLACNPGMCPDQESNQ